uniref:Uncharacterized protein n=1 Tax=Arundo donax TaxID=35708 RepID=A0A0A8ZU53_ARUDO
MDGISDQLTAAAIPIDLVALNLFMTGIRREKLDLVLA